MEIDLAWLLILPLLFALGWITARYDRGQLRRESKHVAKDILDGVSAVLADDLSAATDALLQAARSAPDSPDLHRAVGNLYRRRGMPDRAIEVHETALRNPNLTAEERDEFTLDLGRDFIAAGIFDRAESCLSGLASNSARELLLSVAQRTRNWEQAIHWAQEIKNHNGQFPEAHSFDQLMGHFYCELAEHSLRRSDSAQAQQYLQQAGKHDCAPGVAKRIQAIKERTTTPQSGAEMVSASAWICSACGFRTRQHYWQCPGCHRWDTFGATS